MTFEYSAIPIIVAGLIMVGLLEIIPLRKQRQYREIVVVCILLTVSMVILVAPMVGIRLPAVSASMTKALKGWLGK